MSEKGISGAGVGILVIRDNKVLLGLRNPDPAKADSALHGEGTWTCPGGKIKFGQNFEEAASRELTEETGLAGKSFKVFSVSNDIGTEAHYVTIGLLCENFSGEPKTMEPEEIVEWRWFDLNNLPDNMFFPSRKMAENYINNRFYKVEE
ncbi:MAG: NUDIX domain-containing protein [Patescibacteria group bacterium]